MASQLILFVLVSFMCFINNVELRAHYYEEQADDDDSSATTYRVLPNDDTLKLLHDHDNQNEFKLGQVSGIAGCVKNPNRLIIFQRGSREWTYDSFLNGKNLFNKEKYGLIKENTLLTVNTKNGQIISQFGNDTFYMPHGLSIDNDGNLWLTDVAMHQVFKYDTTQPKRQLVLTIGELFVPGSDQTHFCKPTDVAVSSDGQFVYVADGYCNQRIVKLNSDGKYLTEYKMPASAKQLQIPHSLTLIESLNLICVADRENGRIVCFDAGLDGSENEGNVVGIIGHPTMKTVYAITYDALSGDRLYAVTGGHGSTFGEALGYTFSVNPHSFGRLITTWKSSHNFGEPHDLALSVNSRQLFVGEIRPNRIDVFKIIN